MAQVTTAAQPARAFVARRWLTPLLPLLSLLLFLALWAVLMTLSRFMPSPVAAATAFVGNLADSSTYVNVWISVVRTLVGVGLAMLVGVAVGVLMGYHRYLAAFLGTYVSIGLTIPSLGWAFVSLLLFGRDETGVYFATMIVVFPFVAVQVWEGVKALDVGLLEMARVFRSPRWLTLRAVTLPALLPCLFGSLRNAFALGWKIVIVAEVFGRQDGIGAEYNRWYTSFEMAQVLAWTAVFVLVVTSFEYGILQRLEAYAFRWRPAALSER
jgi:NitT/TauT family transport system permease protein